MKRFAVLVSAVVFVALVVLPLFVAAQPDARRRPRGETRRVDPRSLIKSERPQPKTAKLSKEQVAANRAALQKEGWTESQGEEPDLRVLRLDPAAYAQLKGPMLAQLRSAAFNPEDLERVANLAKSVEDEAAKEEAIGVLVRSPDARAQPLLIDVYKTLPNDTLREQVLGGLAPQDENDDAAKFLAAQLADGKASPQLKQVAARSLAAGVLRQNRGAERLPDGALKQLPPAERAKVSEALTTLRKGSKLHEHTKARTPVARRGGGGGNLRTAPDVPRGRDLQLSPALQAMLKAMKERPEQPHYWAVKVDGNGEVVRVSGNSLNRPGTIRQVLVMPTGYTTDDYQTFAADFDKMVRDMGNLPGEVFTRKYRDKIVYIAHWIPGGAIGTSDVNFAAKLYDHPVRAGKGISMDNRKVVQAVDNFKANHLQTSEPIGVITLFNLDEEVTANAVCPTFLRKPYGIARITREDIHDDMSFGGRTWGEYVPMHELAHGSINWLDEYIEAALDGWDLSTLDPFTFLVLPDNSWQGWNDSWESLIGNYTIRISEILADNGSDNISTRKHTSRVATGGFGEVVYETKGGMFFPIGTRHDEGNNVMNDSEKPDGTLKADGNRFDWDHSPQQKRLLKFIFGEYDKAPRPNDRIRCAGPLHNWLPQWGSSVRLLMFDADKNHRWHPTKKYELEIGWWEWDWDKLDWAWRTMKRTVTPSARDVDLSQAVAAGGLSILRDVLVANGVSDIPTGQGNFNLGALTVSELLNTSLPSIKWPTPYQDAAVTLPIPAYQYYWRFRTNNGDHWSGFTGWSGFFKI